MFSSGEARLSSFRHQRRHKKMAPERAPTSPAGTVSQPIGKPFNGQAKGLLWLTWRSYAGPPQYFIPPEGESPQPACKASADHRQNPGSPGPKGPAAPSTLTPVRACQPSGILESTALVPVPIPTAPQAPEPSFKNSARHLTASGQRLYLTSRISLRRLLFPLLLWFFLLS